MIREFTSASSARRCGAACRSPSPDGNAIVRLAPAGAWIRRFSRLLAILPLAGAIACASNPAPTPPVGDSPDHAGYRAAGNEPFWALTFSETSMDFSSLGRGDTIRAPRPAVERHGDGWRFATTANGGGYVVEIEDRRCGDSMSGRPFPHTVMVTVEGQRYSGCGGDTSSLLIGEEWRVTSLDRAETPGDRVPTLLFASDGALTGHGGCNRFRASFAITGEGIAIGPALATRMACVEPELNGQETRFFALLEQVTRFEIAEDGRLELLAADRPVIVAQR